MNFYEKLKSKENEIERLKDEIKYLSSLVREYKSFIEENLGCRIKETVETDKEYIEKRGFGEVFYKIIEIPKTRIIVKTDNPMILR